jgi:hypothetical protein
MIVTHVVLQVGHHANRHRGITVHTTGKVNFEGDAKRKGRERGGGNEEEDGGREGRGGGRGGKGNGEGPEESERDPGEEVGGERNSKGKEGKWRGLKRKEGRRVGGKRVEGRGRRGKKEKVIATKGVLVYIHYCVPISATQRTMKADTGGTPRGDTKAGEEVILRNPRSLNCTFHQVSGTVAMGRVSPTG